MEIEAINKIIFILMLSYRCWYGNVTQYWLQFINFHFNTKIMSFFGMLWLRLERPVTNKFSLVCICMYYCCSCLFCLFICLLVIFIYLFIYFLFIFLLTHTYTHIHIHKHIYTYIHIYIHTYTHTYINTYIHTYIHTYIIFILFLIN